MGRSAMQKTRILTLVDMLERETDEARGLTMSEIIERYAAAGVKAERKSVYDDLAALESFGIDVKREREKGRTEYRLLSRTFELAELKILVDAVQSAKFITPKKSEELIAKLTTLASDRQSRELKRTVFVADRAKSMNESVLIAVDAIHSAIRDNKRITFRYFDLNAKKEKVYRREKALYEVSPYALAMDDGKYYLIAYDAAADMIKHYRVDKMNYLSVLDEAREGRALFKNFNLAKYVTEHFGMYGGEETLVTLRCEDRLAQIVFDRFGKDVSLRPSGDGFFEVGVRVAVSVHFLAWVLSLSPAMTVTSPQSVRERMRSLVENAAAEYAADRTDG